MNSWVYWELFIIYVHSQVSFQTCMHHKTKVQSPRCHRLCQKVGFRSSLHEPTIHTCHTQQPPLINYTAWKQHTIALQYAHTCVRMYAHIHMHTQWTCLVHTLKQTQNRYLLSEVLTIRVGLCTWGIHRDRMRSTYCTIQECVLNQVLLY